MLVRYKAVATTLDYASVKLPRLPNPRLGRAAAVWGVLSAVAIILLSHQARMDMVTWRGNWCRTGEAMAQSRLYAIGFLQIVPAGALATSFYAKAGIAVCRTSLACAVGGWLVYVFS